MSSLDSPAGSGCHLVGEIRNGETAEIAMNASQTGHLVLSTLHTTDSIGAITRLLDLGVPSYLIAASVTGVLAQRLVRRLCVCRMEKPASAAYTQKLERIGVANADQYKYEYEPQGCSICETTGFKGRVGIYEMLSIEDAVRDAIHSQARSDTILAVARSFGFRTLQEDALEKVKSGLTSLDEIQRVVPWDTIKSSRCQSCSKEITPAQGFCPHCGAGRPANVADAGEVLVGAGPSTKKRHGRNG
jgi:type II secretory ATPase GspE/PulE/Tfp pilus assembly ATPase PilB-like protein